jgi:uncharacterized protein (TIGR01777 family)
LKNLISKTDSWPGTSMKIVISGATGLVGTALAHALRDEGHSVARLVRAGNAKTGDILWDPDAAQGDLAALEGADTFVNLNGASIGDGPWTPERKNLLRSSRVNTTRFLVNAFSRLTRKPGAFLSASAIGFYGSCGDEILTETSASGTDFLSELSREWEREAQRAESFGIRTAVLRFGVILSARGGALPRMLTPFKWGVGGRLGDGKQWMSWIALDDVIGVIRWALTDSQVTGPVNVVAPGPVRNLEFTRVLAKALHRPAVLPAPAFALRLLLGEMADALLLGSQRVRPEKLLALGYPFRFDKLEPALRSALAES